MLGGLIAAHWGWKAAFGVVGFPGLVVALLYLRVRDYRTGRKAVKVGVPTAAAAGALAGAVAAAASVRRRGR